MLVSSEAGAAEIVSSHDETRFYDDIGCLAADWRTSHDSVTGFVRTAEGWLDVMSASFAQPVAARTAMGSGFAAYRTSDEAAAVDRDGRALTWADVVRLTGEQR